MSVFNPPPAELIPPVVQGLKTVSAFMLPAEFKDGTTGKIVIPAPGANKMIVPVSWSMVFLGSGVGYTNTQDFRLRYQGDNVQLCSTGVGIVTVTGSSNVFTGIQQINAWTISLFDPRNKAVWIRCLNTFTGGAAADRMFFTIAYFVTEFQ
jgi:hypothetical protein